MIFPKSKLMSEDISKTFRDDNDLFSPRKAQRNNFYTVHKKHFPAEKFKSFHDNDRDFDDDISN